MRYTCESMYIYTGDVYSSDVHKLRVTRMHTCTTNMYSHVYVHAYIQVTNFQTCVYGAATISRLLKLKVSFAKEPYERDDILQKRPTILRSLLIVATP